MKTPFHASLTICFFIAAIGLGKVSAAPVDYREVSLLVRAHEKEATIVDAVTQRKLLRLLTPEQEKILKAQGATDSLLRTLHNPSLALSADDAAAFEAAREQKLKLQDRETPDQTDDDQGAVRIFDVAFGHPINLGEWGGADYEFAFYSHRFAGEDVIEPVLIDNSRTFTDEALYVGPQAIPRSGFARHRREQRFTPYLGGDLKDEGFQIGPYAATSAHFVSRRMKIDRDNPVWIKGIPYTLYPVYGVQGASLYYIGPSTERANSVKIAVANYPR